MKKQLISLFLDRTSRSFLMLMDNSRFDHLQIGIQQMLGDFKAINVECGCTRPQSCGSCRTTVEDEIYWGEKMDDLLQEAINEDRDNQSQAH